MWRIEFESSEFLPFLPEEAQSNPGVYGFELASWLSRGLAKKNLATPYPLQEDWGWLIEHAPDDVVRLVGCSSVCGEGEGYEGKSITWSIFVEQKKSAKESARAITEQLQRAISALLEGEQIAWRLE
jgi:hypothetical protein